MENARLFGELRQRTQELTRREIALRNSEERHALAMRAVNRIASCSRLTVLR